MADLFVLTNTLGTGDPDVKFKVTDDTQPKVWLGEIGYFLIDGNSLTFVTAAGNSTDIIADITA